MDAVAYSEFMHRLNGLFVLLLGIVALLERRSARWSAALRWGWPILFFISGVYLMIRSDQDGWPIGGGFIESLHDPTILQHKIAATILLLLALSEGLLRASRPRLNLAWIFPVLAVLAGLGLFFHGGTHLPKIHRQHRIMGWTALGIGITRGASGRIRGAGAIWPVLILLLGLELLFYSEL
jgi:putative copper resistance protein D